MAVHSLFEIRSNKWRYHIVVCFVFYVFDACMVVIIDLTRSSSL